MNVTKGKELTDGLENCLILHYASQRVVMKEVFLRSNLHLILKFGFLKLRALMSQGVNLLNNHVKSSYLDFCEGIAHKAEVSSTDSSIVTL